MAIGHVTQTGNISIPKEWRDALGIAPNSGVIIERQDDKIVIEPLKKKSLKEAFSRIDEEVKRKKIRFTREEAIRDDLYD
jgi:AbrB family looped-hinge helix DNA binding protein